MRRNDILDEIQEKRINRRKVLTVGAATLISASTTAKARGSKEYEQETIVLESHDGTKLVARIFDPDNESGIPKVIPHSWAMSKGKAIKESRSLARNGRFVVQYDQRGYGQSEGEKEQNDDELNGIKDLSSITKYVEKEYGVKQSSLKVFP